MRDFGVRLTVLILVCACAACATPVQKIENFAKSRQLSRTEIESGPSHLVAFRNDAARLLRSSVSGKLATLHIYIEGDGAPLSGGEAVTVDPTPKDTMALRLMALDPQPSIYITRPCTHGNSTDRGCSSALWTHARYGVAVLDRLVQAIRRVSADAGKPNIVLIGYDGGGVLAMLLASRVDQVIGLVTVASRLDTESLTRENDSIQLSGSLNPARQPAISTSVAQLHLVGGRDEIASPAAMARFLATQPGAAMEVFEDFDQSCCWDQAWPEVLTRLQSRLHH